MDFNFWKNQEINFRLNSIKNLALLLHEDIEIFSKLITNEMGKPLYQSKLEIQKCIKLCEYYFETSENILSDKPINLPGQKGFIAHEPLGIILGIMPWNFPFWQVFRFIIPTIIAGNGVLLKHSPNVQGCASQIEKCFQKSGFPKNLIRNIRLKKNKVKKVINTLR